MIFLVLIQLSLAALVIQSPYLFSNTSIPFSLSTFGTPILYPIYGEIIIINQTTCTFNSSVYGKFILVKNLGKCPFETWAKSAYLNQAKLIIFNLTSLTALIPYDKDLADSINIPVIGITSEFTNSILSFSSSKIWATAVYEMKANKNIDLVFSISGNYTQDSKYFNALSKYYNNTQAIFSSFSIQISYLDQNDPLVNIPQNDCTSVDANGVICMASQNGVLGRQKVENSYKIYKIYYSSKTLSTFLNNITVFYKSCINDYSDDCLNKYLKFEKRRNLASSFLPPFNKTYILAPYSLINDQSFFWPNYIENAFYLANSSAQTTYGQCSIGCTNALLGNNLCDPNCNNIPCSYDNLKCLYDNNCPSFLLSDGQCDPQCVSDPDCKNNLCSTGCSFSDMSSGLCPLSCTGNCFLKCDQTLYCSPGCLYSDLKSGKCSDSCSSDCLKKCQKTQCSSGCYYSDWKIGICSSKCSSDCLEQCQKEVCKPGCGFSDMQSNNCPVQCSGYCFNYCNNLLFCSPGCKYSGWDVGYINSACSSDCSNWYNSRCYSLCGPLGQIDYQTCPYYCLYNGTEDNTSNDHTKIIAITVPVSIVGFLLLVAIIIVLVKVCKTKNLNRPNIEIDGPNPAGDSFELDEPHVIDNKIIPDPPENFDIHPQRFDRNVRFVGDAVCTIDLSGFLINDFVIVTPCLHIFHQGCIREWLNNARSENRCPNCNRDLSDYRIH